ncbi:hypothetical protein ACLBWS_03775 [Brucellaceae bacterium D45D]
MERHEEARLPLLAYAPAYPGKMEKSAPLGTTVADNSHNDIAERMHAVRDALQSRLEIQQPLPESTATTWERAGDTTKDTPKPRTVSLWRRIFGAGPSTPSHTEIASDERFNASGETGLAAVIRKANERWEAENRPKKPS